MGVQEGQRPHEGSGPSDCRQQALSSLGTGAWGEEMLSLSAHCRLICPRQMEEPGIQRKEGGSQLPWPGTHPLLAHSAAA